MSTATSNDLERRTQEYWNVSKTYLADAEGVGMKINCGDGLLLLTGILEDVPTLRKVWRKAIKLQDDIILHNRGEAK